MGPIPEGLAVLVAETTPSTLTYHEWEKFTAFVAHKDLAGTLVSHRVRGLPETEFVETYRRFAKSLVAVGSGTGADRALGLETEVVALSNPYIDPLAAGMPVQVLYLGAPRANAQVELFDKAPDGAVKVTLHRTDDKGIVTLPVQAGHAYLVDAVVMRAVEPKLPTDPVWESLWAALTFAVPQ